MQQRLREKDPPKPEEGLQKPESPVSREWGCLKPRKSLPPLFEQQFLSRSGLELEAVHQQGPTGGKQKQPGFGFKPRGWRRWPSWELVTSLPVSLTGSLNPNLSFFPLKGRKQEERKAV